MLIVSTLLSAAIAALLTPRVAAWARRRGVVDRPGVEPRKAHARPTPLLGGAAVYVAFALTVGAIAWFTGAPFAGRISPFELGVVLLGGLLLVTGGALDDRYGLRPWQQLLAPLLAVGIVAAAGVGVTRVTNPLGGVLMLAPLVTVALTVTWLLGTTYATKLLDGLDGLVAGITAIGALLIAALSLTERYHQPDVAILALALAGACIGFLPWNMHPARVFLGEGGSTVCGFLLGVLAIISGGKLMTVLLVLGVAVVDAAAVVAQRVAATGRPFTADRRHLHFRLLDLGLTHRAAVAILWAVALAFGSLTLLLQASQKLIALGVLAAVTTVVIAVVALRERRTPTTVGRGHSSVRENPTLASLAGRVPPHGLPLRGASARGMNPTRLGEPHPAASRGESSS